MRAAPIPCLGTRSNPRCVEYAEPGQSRCASCQREAIAKGEIRTGGRGGTPAWSRARKRALDRDGHRCRECGKTQAQAKAESPSGKGLHVHHRSGEGVRAETHQLDDLVTLCWPCHKKTLRKKTTWRQRRDEEQAAIRARAAARRGEAAG